MTRRKDTELFGLFRKSDVEAEYARRLDSVIEACAKAAVSEVLEAEELSGESIRAAVIAAGRKAAGRGR